MFHFLPTEDQQNPYVLLTHTLVRLCYNMSDIGIENAGDKGKPIERWGRKTTGPLQ